MDPVYWVRGDDGLEYGPVTLVQLREWWAEDRIGRGSQVSRGSADGPWIAWERDPDLLELEKPAPETAYIAPAFSSRLAAYALDILMILFGASSCLTLAVSLVPVEFVLDASAALENMRQGLPPSFEQKYVEFLFLLTQFVYFTYFHGKHGCTFGKKMFGLKLISLRATALTWPQCALRSLGMLVAAMPFYLGFLFAFINPEQRAFHDVIAGTRVVRKTL